jgi:hypothetical protein
VLFSQASRHRLNQVWGEHRHTLSIQLLVLLEEGALAITHDQACGNLEEGSCCGVSFHW